MKQRSKSDKNSVAKEYDDLLATAIWSLRQEKVGFGVSLSRSSLLKFSKIEKV